MAPLARLPGRGCMNNARIHYSERMNYAAKLREARLARGLSLEATAELARCSTSYVHKLELDRVKTPSPRVLDRLASALGIDYSGLMAAAGYRPAAEDKPARPVKRIPVDEAPSNATILRVLLDVRREVASIKTLVGKPGAVGPKVRT
jgi:transcriptional regulator with XRE-family HTH domain